MTSSRVSHLLLLLLNWKNTTNWFKTFRSCSWKILILKFHFKMPRPGPRPYECVRRAWHSERHQPMRGSTIQQIFRFWVLLFSLAIRMSSCCLFFLIYSYIIWLPTICLIRVADEFHSTQTKKNKEWQEKLPIVVLKAEEILYSKANSEVFPSWFCLKDFGSLSLSLFLCLFSFKIFIFTLFHCSGWVHESWYVTGPCKWCR